MWFINSCVVVLRYEIALHEMCQTLPYNSQYTSDVDGVRNKW